MRRSKFVDQARSSAAIIWSRNRRAGRDGSGAVISAISVSARRGKSAALSKWISPRGTISRGNTVIPSPARTAARVPARDSHV